MMGSQSNHVEARRADGGTKLSIQIIDDDTKRIIGLLEPMVLYGSEHQLRGGRFHAYDATVRSHPVTTGFRKNNAMYQGFINMVEWIAESAHGRWAFFFEAYGDWDADLTFYFDDAQDAMLFRLSIN